ncbi:hypothetical protein D3C72_1826660 [compost metagenome]
MYQHNLGLGVIQRVEDLLRRQAYVHGKQRCPHHRNAEVALQIAMAIPVQYRHRRAVARTERAQRRRKPADALTELAEAVAQVTAIGNFLIAVKAQCVDQQLLDEQRVRVRRRRWDDEIFLHVCLHLLIGADVGIM